MIVRQSGQAVRIQAPAKLNLFLEVLGRRSDGYHELESLMVPVNLYDTLDVSPNAEGSVQLQCRWAYGFGDWEPLPNDSRNLVYRAVEHLRAAAGVPFGATIQLVKRIPSAAGLGGGSSDAAAALVAANLVWGLGWSRSQLSSVAAKIGSDVPFFLLNGPALAHGRGEVLELVGTIPVMPVIIVKPVEGLSTAAVYGAHRPANAPRNARPLLQCLRNGGSRRCGTLLYNRLIPAAESLSPWPARLRQEFDQLGLCGHQMSGSGTSYFGICRSAEQARQALVRLRARRLGMVFATTTLGS